MPIEVYVYTARTKVHSQRHIKAQTEYHTQPIIAKSFYCASQVSGECPNSEELFYIIHLKCWNQL